MESRESFDQVRVFRSFGELQELRDFWDASRPHRDADFEFFHFFAQTNPATLRPHVVALYRDGRPYAALVGRLDTARIPIKVGYLNTPTPRLKILQFVHGGWLGDISDPTCERLVGSIVQSLKEGEADAAMLHNADISSPLVRSARSIPPTLCRDRLLDPQIHRARNLPATAAEFRASLSQNERYKQKKRGQKLGRDFQAVRVTTFQSPNEIDDLVLAAEAVASKSYQRVLGVGFADTPMVRARLNFEARMGRLRGNVLFLDDRPVAFWIGSLINNVFVAEYLSYDPAYEQHSPGMYLMLAVMERWSEQSGDDAVGRVDFGLGDAGYKQRVATEHWHEVSVYIFAPRIKPAAINAARTCVGLLTISSKRLLSRIGILSWIKRHWRTRLSKRA